MRFVRPRVALLGFSLPDLQAHAKSELVDNPFLGAVCFRSASAGGISTGRPSIMYCTAFGPAMNS